MIAVRISTSYNELPIKRECGLKAGLPLLFVVAFVLVSGGFADTTNRLSVDFEKVQKKKFTRYILHLCWPSDEEIKSKSIDKKLIPKDIEAFNIMLKKALKPEYLPSEKVINSNIIAVENLREENDYLLLEYTCGGCRIEIQDGKEFYIHIYPIESTVPESKNITDYVKSTALKMFNIPDDLSFKNELLIHASTLDSGNSQHGALEYRPETEPFKYWYSPMRWWSDGRDILFFIGKGILVYEHDYSDIPHPPREFFLPRKFTKVSE